MKLDELKEHCLKTLKQTEKFPTKTFEEHALVLQLIRNQTSVVEELEKIKAEILKKVWRDAQGQIVTRDGFNHGIITATDIIDNHISELKGE